jgi:enoyl-CoA hydratase
MTDDADEQGFKTLLLERRGRVALVQLNRPNALNALNSELMDEVTRVLADLDSDSGVGAIILTGSKRAFAAGADIKEMQSKSFAEVFTSDLFAPWDSLSRLRTPLIAAVAGYALGGGCELAMLCDVLLAADTAVFGQPEVKLGVIPGIGGSQRLTRAVGKAKAMEMCLTGRTIDAAEAERANLVSRIVAADQLLDEAWAVAETIAAMSKPVTAMVKEVVNKAFETTLTEGVAFERRIFHSAFALEDQTEGMSAFVDKRTPNFRHR